MSNITQENTKENKSGDLAITIFHNPNNAHEAFRDLLGRGYTKDQIIVMMSEKTKEKHFSSQEVQITELGSKALEGTGIGGTIGGTVGAIAASIAAIGTTLVIPALGIVVAGSIAAAFAGAGAGAAIGGLTGALVGLGIRDDLAKEFEAGIKEGGIVIGVYAKHPDDYNLLNEHWRISQSGSTMPLLGL